MGVAPSHSSQADPLGVREDFPVTAEGIYLDSAYITPPPGLVVEAGARFLKSKARKPISLWEMLARTNEVRDKFARLVSVSSDEIGFLYATTEGENIVARQIGLERGDNVVVDELHYSTSYILYKHLEETLGIELRIARQRGGAVPNSEFERLVDARTRLISVAWVSHQNGFRHDMKGLGELAHAHGAYLYTDAVQAVGMFPTQLGETGIDFLASGTYKWLLAGYGGGTLLRFAESFWTASGRIEWERSRSKRSSETIGIGFTRGQERSSMRRLRSMRSTNWARHSTISPGWGSNGSENIRSPSPSDCGADWWSEASECSRLHTTPRPSSVSFTAEIPIRFAPSWRKTGSR